MRTKERSQKDNIPLSLVALKENNPVGTVALWENDLKSRQDLRPYLATLYVVPEERKKGVGKLLVDFAIQKARDLGERNLYLIADPGNNYYASLGWQFLSDEKTHFGESTCLWKYNL